MRNAFGRGARNGKPDLFQIMRSERSGGFLIDLVFAIPIHSLPLGELIGESGRIPMSEAIKSRLHLPSRILALLVAIPACIAAYWAGVALGPSHSAGGHSPSPDSSEQRINGLAVSKADLDFGEAWEDPEFVRKLTILNRGNQSVRVLKLHGGCECTSVEPFSLEIPPGGSRVVMVKIDLTHRYPYQFGVDRRELVVPIHAEFAGRGLAAESWKVLGVVKSRVSVDGRELAFADLCGQGESVTRAMKATAHVPLANLEASCPPDMAKVVVVPAPKRPGGYDVRVTPRPDLPLGPFKFDVGLSATMSDGAKHRCVAFRVTGEMGSPARVIPGTVLLGEHLVGSTTEATVSLRLPADGWTVDRVETELPTTKVTRAPPLDERPTYRITQTIPKPGDGSCQVHFVSRRPDGQIETVPVNVRWYGEPREECK